MSPTPLRQQPTLCLAFTGKRSRISRAAGSLSLPSPLQMAPVGSRLHQSCLCHHDRLHGCVRGRVSTMRASAPHSPQVSEMFSCVNIWVKMGSSLTCDRGSLISDFLSENLKLQSSKVPPTCMSTDSFPRWSYPRHTCPWRSEAELKSTATIRMGSLLVSSVFTSGSGIRSLGCLAGC